MRDAVNDAMDIHGGRAVQDGPANYLFASVLFLGALLIGGQHRVIVEGEKLLL